MNKPLIHSLDRWEDVFELFSRDLRFGPLKRSGISAAELITFLAPVITIAKWMHQNQEKFNGQNLHVAVAGAYLTDAVDEGHWYSFLPILLGRDADTVRVDLVGPELGRPIPEAGGLSSLQTGYDPEMLLRLPVITKVNSLTLGEYLDRAPDLDLIVFPQPGFMTLYDSWFFNDDGVGRVIESGINNFQTVYSYEDYCVDRIFLEQLGFEGCGEFHEGKFADFKAMEISGGDQGIGSFSGWTTLPTIAPEKLDENAIDEGAIDAILDQYTMVAGPGAIGKHYYFDGLLEHFILQDEGTETDLITLMHNCFADAFTGKIYYLDLLKEDLEDSGLTIDTELFSEKPRFDDNLYLRLQWACKVASTYQTAKFSLPGDKPSRVDLLQMSPEKMVELLDKKFQKSMKEHPELEGLINTIRDEYMKDMSRFID